MKVRISHSSRHYKALKARNSCTVSFDGGKFGEILYFLECKQQSNYYVYAAVVELLDIVHELKICDTSHLFEVEKNWSEACSGCHRN